MNRTFFVFGLMCVLSLAFLGACSEESTDAVSKASPQHSDKKVTLPPTGADYEIVGIKEGLAGYMIKYDDKMYRGGQMTTQEGLDYVKSLGVKTIVTITPTDVERKYVAEAKIKLVEVPFVKTDGPSKEILDTFLEAVKTSDGPVYVHCHGGTHRAAILAAVYRMSVQGWDYDRTVIEYGTLGGDLKGDYGMLTRIRQYAPAATNN
ncbi:MAG: hypothetical protein HN350_08195 [Phycisphaerales bacterium]|jgi:protein tyrosine phosphatase (PTP) superfamily phosphohydrolase (DUF442 family)|nr:hypothetical protein [Phycisphaerales bacterium]